MKTFELTDILRVIAVEYMEVGWSSKAWSDEPGSALVSTVCTLLQLDGEEDTRTAVGAMLYSFAQQMKASEVAGLASPTEADGEETSDEGEEVDSW